MSGAKQHPSVVRSARTNAVYGAWERFIQGEDDIRGVRPEVAISWQRCRDQYRVDPFLSEAPVAASHLGHPLEHDIVITELGFRAAAISHEVAGAGGVVSIADAGGRVLAIWGDPATRAAAEETRLAPWFCWSERAVGTNGMGTALAGHSNVVMVRREEHWCKAMHDWSCVGVAVRDVVTGAPIAVMNISCLRSDLPQFATSWLGSAASSTQRRLRSRARSGAAELLAAYDLARSRCHEPVFAVDLAGKVVIADDLASVLLGVPASTPALDPATRWVPQLPALPEVVRLASQQAHENHDWTGSTHIYTHLADEPSAIRIEPVFLDGGLVGHVVTFGGPTCEQLPQGEVGIEPISKPRRVVGMCDNRMVLLRLPEVTLAESDGSDVWLSTDRGRMRAASAGLDKLDQELTGAGFLRAHRSYVVNTSRVREVERREKGELILVMDDENNTQVPVSRRNARAVRTALGI